MLRTADRRKTPVVIELDRNGRPKGRWKRWLTNALKIVATLTGIFAFIKDYGWKAFGLVVAFAGTIGAAIIEV